MAKHYLETVTTVENIIDYNNGSTTWSKISLTITITAGGDVSYTATCTNKDGQYVNKGLYITVNGNTVGNNYYNALSECEASFGAGSKFPIYSGTSASKSAGTVSGDSVSWEVKLCTSSDGSVHGWTGSTSSNNAGTTKSGSVTREYYNDPGLPTVSVNNTKKNSFTVSATKGSNGTGSPNNNTATGVTSVQYSYNNSTWINYTGEVTITEDKKVYARAKTDGTLSDSDYKTVGPVDVYYYTPPTQATNLTISSSKSKYTPKANYTFSWVNPEAGDHNALSYVLFRLYKNNVQITNDADYQMTDGRTSITFTPQQLGGLNKGDTLYFSVDGLATNTNFDLGPATSEPTTIVNAAILKVKTEEGWKEGQAFVKTKDGWKEASSVFIKSAKGWKEPK